jgi:hypothetical protein
VLTGYRSGLVPLLTLALAATGLSACNRSKPQEKSTTAAVKKSPAELKQLADTAKEGLNGLEGPLTSLQERITELHKEFDPLPPGLIGFGETRSEFYSLSEGVGTLQAKVRWLSGRLDSATKAGDATELEQLTKDIGKTYDEVAEAARMSIALVHKVQPFKTAREVKVEDVLGPIKCDPSGQPIAPNQSKAPPPTGAKAPPPTGAKAPPPTGAKAPAKPH